MLVGVISAAFFAFVSAASLQPPSVDELPPVCRSLSIKRLRQCGEDLSGYAVRPLLITGSGGSGTHAASDLLQSLGVDVGHEDHMGSAGSASWPFAVDGLQSPVPACAAQWYLKPARTVFERVVHIVRCPIRTIAAFQTHKPCSWEYIRTHMGIQTPWNKSRSDDLRLYAEAWLRWNEHVEAYADARVRADNPQSLLDAVCHQKGTICEAAAAPSIRSNHRDHTDLQWSDLFSIDAALTSQVRRKARAYGFGDTCLMHGLDEEQPSKNIVTVAQPIVPVVVGDDLRLLQGSGEAKRRVRKGGRGSEASSLRPASASRTLLFCPVGNSERVVRLIAGNIEYARAQAFDFDTYLVHYVKGGRAAWEAILGSSWYTNNVKFTSERKGFKFQLMRSLLARPKFHLEDYRWVWALDEDVQINSMSLPRFLQLADKTGSLLLTPAFVQRGKTREARELIYPHQAPNSSCIFRHVPMIEVIMPLLRSDALAQLLFSCEHCIHNKTSWGMDMMWCVWAAKQLNHSIGSACAVIDATVAHHLNFKSLAGKYSANGSLTTSFLGQGMADISDVRAFHMLDWVEKKNAGSVFWCEPKLAVSIMVFVMSRRGDFHTRGFIRDMWLQAKRLDSNLHYNFFVCDADDSFRERLFQEQVEFGDIILSVCVEGYFNGLLTRKSLAAMRLFQARSEDLFMKIDDDSFVAWRRLLPYLLHFGSTHAYMGVRSDTAPPIRDPLHRWYEPLWTFPKSMFPEGFDGGPGYILGRGLVEAILDSAIWETNVLWNEDRAVAVWIDELRSRGENVAFVEIPGLVNTSLPAPPSWHQWQTYPYMLHHKLTGVQISCLALADELDLPKADISQCFREDGHVGHIGTLGVPLGRESLHSFVAWLVFAILAALFSGRFRKYLKTPLASELPPASALLLKDCGPKVPEARSYHWDFIKFVCMFLVVWEHMCGFMLGIWASYTTVGWPVPQLLGLTQHVHMPIFSFISGMFSTASVKRDGDGRVLILSRHMDNSMRDLLLPQITVFALMCALQICRDIVARWSLPHFQIPSFPTLWYLSALLVWRLSIPLLCRLRYPVLFAVVAHLAFRPDEKKHFVVNRIVFFLPFFVIGFVAGGNRADIGQPPLVQQLERSMVHKHARAIAGAWALAVGLACLLPGMESEFRDTSLQSLPWSEGGWLRDSVKLASRSLCCWSLMVGCFAAPGKVLRVGARMGSNTLYVYVLHSLIYRDPGFQEAFAAAFSKWNLQAQVLILAPIALAVTMFLSSDFVHSMSQCVVQPQWLVNMLVTSRPFEHTLEEIKATKESIVLKKRPST